MIARPERPLDPSRRKSVRCRLAEVDVRPSKRRGQNFLADARVARRIVDAAEVRGRRILEIGSGLGALTEEIVAREPRALVAIEVDAGLARHLRERFETHDDVHVIEADALEVSWGDVLGDERPWSVVANLPYSVGTPILLALLEEPGRFDRLLVMLQREVAGRILAAPGSRDYGPLTVAVAMRARARRLFHVSPGSFRPRPKVDSTVIAIEPLAESPIPADLEDTFRLVVRTAFGQRRKMLRRALARLASEAAFGAAGIDPARRGETLSFAELTRLAEAIAAHPLA